MKLPYTLPSADYFPFLRPLDVMLPSPLNYFPPGPHCPPFSHTVWYPPLFLSTTMSVVSLPLCFWRGVALICPLVQSLCVLGLTQVLLFSGEFLLWNCPAWCHNSSAEVAWWDMICGCQCWVHCWMLVVVTTQCLTLFLTTYERISFHFISSIRSSCTLERSVYFYLMYNDRAFLFILMGRRLCGICAEDILCHIWHLVVFIFSLFYFSIILNLFSPYVPYHFS